MSHCCVILSPPPSKHLATESKPIRRLPLFRKAAERGPRCPPLQHTSFVLPPARQDVPLRCNFQRPPDGRRREPAMTHPSTPENRRADQPGVSPEWWRISNIVPHAVSPPRFTVSSPLAICHFSVQVVASERNDGKKMPGATTSQIDVLNILRVGANSREQSRAPRGEKPERIRISVPSLAQDT